MPEPEAQDDYPHVIVQVNNGRRVVVTSDGLFYLIQQQRDDGLWSGASYCRSRYVLVQGGHDDVANVVAGVVSQIESQLARIDQQRATLEALSETFGDTPMQSPLRRF